MRLSPRITLAPLLLALAVCVTAGGGVLAFAQAPASVKTDLRFAVHTSAVGPSTASTTSVVVGYLPSAKPMALASARKLGGHVRRDARSGGFSVVDAPAGTSVTAFVRRLEMQPGVMFAEPNGLMHIASTPADDPGFIAQWGLSRIGASEAWDVSRGAGVTVAVIDTGVSLSHPDLLGRIDSVNDYDFVNFDDTAADDQGHGTHVAGIVAANLNNSIGVVGVAPQCTILPIKVLDRTGYGTNAEVADGIRWAASHGADVINLSLGSGDYSDVVAAAVDYAIAHDCVVVAAAGNDGASSIYYPARLPGVIGVGATGRSDTRGSYSNYGVGVDISAPGTDIYSTLMTGGYGYKTGTSMASPHVAGVVALVRAAHPEWTRAQVENQVLGTALDLGVAGRDDYFGFGRVRAAEALGSVSGTFTALGDNDIPGVEILQSPVVGYLSASGDIDDVYSVYLRRGQTIQTVLSGGAGTDFDLYLYGPGATSVEQTSAIVAYANREQYPDAFTFRAPASGHYYLCANAYRGAGSYTIRYTITAPVSVDGNDDIPGSALSSATQAGSLDATDVADVYAVSLKAGRRLSLRMTGPDEADFDLYLYGPSARSIFADAPMARSTGASSTESIVCTIPATGTYYVSAYAYQGEGPYVLDHLVETAAPDDDVPGVVVPSSPVTGTVAGGMTGFDPDDVFRVHLTQGQWVFLQLDATAPNVDLFLWAPGTASVDAPSGDVVASSTTTGSAERVLYRASVTGDYYIDVRASTGAGEYTLVYGLPVTQPAIDATGSATVAYGGTGWVSGRLVDESGAPMPSTAVHLLSAAPGAGWAVAASTETSSDGSYRFSVSPKSKTAYTVEFGGSVDLLGARSDVVTITPCVLVGTPVAPAKMSRSRSASVYVTLRPRHTAGTYPVRIFKWRRVNGTWKSYGYVKAKASDYFSYTRCAASIRLPYAGTWRLRAYAPTDGGHLATWSSGYDLVTVR